MSIDMYKKKLSNIIKNPKNDEFSHKFKNLDYAGEKFDFANKFVHFWWRLRWGVQYAFPREYGN